MHILDGALIMLYAARTKGKGYGVSEIGVCEQLSAHVGGINAMSTILVPETFMLEMIWVQHNQRVENVYHIRTPGRAPLLADLVQAQQLADNWWKDAVAGNLRTQTASTASLVKIECTSLHAVGEPVHEFVPSPFIAGARTGLQLPAYVSLAVRWGTGKSGRSFRGRTYMVAPGYQAQSDGLIAAGDATAVQAAFQRWLNNVNATGMQLVVASKYSGVEIVNGRRRGIPRAAGITTPILTCGVERGLDTRRSRKVPHLV